MRPTARVKRAMGVFSGIPSEGVPKRFWLYRVKGQKMDLRRTGKGRQSKALLENCAPWRLCVRPSSRRDYASRKGAKAQRKTERIAAKTARLRLKMEDDPIFALSHYTPASCKSFRNTLRWGLPHFPALTQGVALGWLDAGPLALGQSFRMGVERWVRVVSLPDCKAPGVFS